MTREEKKALRAAIIWQLRRDGHSLRVARWVAMNALDKKEEER